MNKIPNKIKSKFLEETCRIATKQFINENPLFIKSNTSTSISVFTDEKIASRIINEVYTIVTRDYNNHIDNIMDTDSNYNYSLIFDDSYQNNKLTISWSY